MRDVKPNSPKRTKGTLATVALEKRWLTVHEAERYIGFGSRDKQQEWRDSGMLPYYLIGRQIVYDKSDLDRFIQKHKVVQFNH